MMRRNVVGVLVVILLIGLSLATLAAKPIVKAHGEFWTDIHIAGQWFDIQFAFNVQDRGQENDHGALSMRIFDHWTGKLVAVGVSPRIVEVFVDEGWVVFYAELRVTRFDEDYYLPLHYPLYEFRAFDGGDSDQFMMFARPMPIYSGKIVIR